MRPAEELVAVSSLIPWDQNPRINQAAADKLVRVIERFGFLDPLIVRRSDRRVVAGHTRLLSAQRLGMAEVPVIWVDLSDDDARDLAVAHNRVAEEAEWDPALLALLVGDGLDLVDVGFESTEIDHLLSALDPDGASGAGETAPGPTRVASFTLHLWPHDELEGLLATVATPGEARAATVIRALRALQTLQGGE